MMLKEGVQTLSPDPTKEAVFSLQPSWKLTIGCWKTTSLLGPDTPRPLERLLERGHLNPELNPKPQTLQTPNTSCRFWRICGTQIWTQVTSTSTTTTSTETSTSTTTTSTTTAAARDVGGFPHSTRVSSIQLLRFADFVHPRQFIHRWCFLELIPGPSNYP